MPSDTTLTALAADTLPAGTGFTLADLSRRWRIGGDKIRAFLRKGELVGVNLAGSLSAKPQWRVSPEEVARFEKRRSSAPPAKAAPRRRRREAQIDYFP
jgi:hypothetical protein